MASAFDSAQNICENGMVMLSSLRANIGMSIPAKSVPMLMVWRASLGQTYILVGTRDEVVHLHLVWGPWQVVQNAIVALNLCLQLMHFTDCACPLMLYEIVPMTNLVLQLGALHWTTIKGSWLLLAAGGVSTWGCGGGCVGWLGSSEGAVEGGIDCDSSLLTEALVALSGHVHEL